MAIQLKNNIICKGKDIKDGSSGSVHIKWMEV